MTPDAAIRALIAAGYAVVVFAPEELHGVDRHRLEEVMMTRGNDYIADHGDDEDE